MKTYRRSLFICLILSLIFLESCQPEPFLTVNPTNLSFTQEGGSQTVSVSANYAWTASVDGSGFSLSPQSGEGDASVTITASAAISTDETKATVTFRSEGLSATVSLTKEGISTILVGSVNVIPSKGGTYTVDIEYNTSFSVEVESAASSWITFNGTKALSSGKLEFSFAENNTPESRTGSVTIKDKGGKVNPITLTFVQDEKIMILVGDGMTIPEEGGTFGMEVQYNTDYSVEVESSAQSWITCIRTKALTNGTLEFRFEPNEGDERTGKVTLIDNTGKVDPIVLTFVQQKQTFLWKARRLAEKLYEAWDATHWTNDPWIPGKNWPGLIVISNPEIVELRFNHKGITGPIPACIGDFGEMLTTFVLNEESGVTGTLPDSFRKLTGLKNIFIQLTGLTSVPEVFADMKKLESVFINSNESMAGPLPQSISSPVLGELYFSNASFTGTIPDSWAPYAGFMSVFNNCLTGKISHLFSNREDLKAFINESNLWQKTGYGFDISDMDIPGCVNWFEGQLLENLDGTTFSIPEVVSQNKYTVYMYWALWCPFSKELMPQLRDYYEKYKQDGLEVIATIQVGDDFNLFHDYERQKKECVEKGYDGWYNFYWSEYGNSLWMSVPVAEVYDQQGNILFSSCNKYPDPVRNRFDRTASSELIPFLETLLGPAEVPDPYESTDYSKDGEVMTLQEASVGQGIDIVFLGDAYTDRDMASGGLYETVMTQAMEEFFADEPYKSFRNRFNVYAVKVVSKNGRIGEGYSTALSTSFGIGSYVEGNDPKCYEYAMKVPGITSYNDLLVVVLANSRRHAGTTFLYPDGQTSVAYVSSMDNDPSVFGHTLRHEAGGHGFAFLADEYSEHTGTPPADHVSYYNEVYDMYGWFSNVDFTDDPSKVRWSAFLADSRYSGKVGIYEGGALYEKGAYRPTVNSIMRENYGGFNAPSRWAIYQQIMKRSGETPTFDKFLEYDAVNLTRSSVRPPLKAAANGLPGPGAPPVVVR